MKIPFYLSKNSGARSIAFHQAEQFDIEEAMAGLFQSGGIRWEIRCRFIILAGETWCTDIAPRSSGKENLLQRGKSGVGSSLLPAQVTRHRSTRRHRITRRTT